MPSTRRGKSDAQAHEGFALALILAGVASMRCGSAIADPLCLRTHASNQCADPVSSAE